MEEPIPDGPPAHEGDPVVLENQTPHTVYYVYALATGIVQAYGWYIVITVIVLTYLYSKWLPYFNRHRPVWNHSADHVQYDSEEVFRRQEAMDAARRRLQEQHMSMAERFAEEQKKKEEEKRKLKIEDWDRHLEGKGYRSKVKPQETDAQPINPAKKKKNVYRSSDYNPLTGTSGGACFRPSRPSGSGGG